MKITLCNWDARPAAFDVQAEVLADHVKSTGSDLVLLPEMPFTPWLAIAPERQKADWDKSVADHEARIPQLAGIIKTAIAGSRPVVVRGSNRNQSFVWGNGKMMQVSHQKRALPSEEGYWEARWYDPGTQATAPIDFSGVGLGFAICTELWDTAHGATLSRSGADVILVPRATPDFGDDVWIAGIRSLAVQTGCYVISSNFKYPLSDDFAFEGLSAASDPDGVLLGKADCDNPFITVCVDRDVSRAAKCSYPRYIFNQG